MIDLQALRERWDNVGSKLDERERRLFAAGEVRAAGWGALSAVSKITGFARSTLARGLKELEQDDPQDNRQRHPGAGRPKHTDTGPTLLDDLKRIIEPWELGDPERPLMWVSKSHRKLASALRKMGHKVSANTVRRLLPKLGFSRKANRKTDEGSSHPDRNAQFEHINSKVEAAQAAGQPVISVDTKKKELVGNYKNNGTDYRPKGDPLKVKVYDFVDKHLGKVAPYGVYDVTANEGWVSVGVTHDTAEFAAQSIRCWLESMGRKRYPTVRDLTITADCGGSNGARVRLWKMELLETCRRREPDHPRAPLSAGNIQME